MLFDTTANLLTTEGPTVSPATPGPGRPSRCAATAATRLRAQFSAPSGNPRENKGSNHESVLSKMYRATNNVEISITYFGGGPIERFKSDGESVPTDWVTGRPDTKSAFFACSQIQVAYGGVNRITPTACAQPTFG